VRGVTAGAVVVVVVVVVSCCLVSISTWMLLEFLVHCLFTKASSSFPWDGVRFRFVVLDRWWCVVPRKERHEEGRRNAIRSVRIMLVAIMLNIHKMERVRNCEVKYTE